jgi:anti-anti-sigma factor
MDAIERTFSNGIVVEKVNLLRASMNEAFRMKEYLIDDSIDHKQIIVDLSSCEYIDSTFFGALVFAYRKTRERDGAIVLVLSNTFLSKSFIYKEISSIFQVHHSIKEAITEFNKHQKEVVEDAY